MSYYRSVRARSRVAIGVALAVAALMALSGLWTPARAAGTVYYVNPATGADTNSGTSSTAAFKTIQKALDLAQPGTTINLAAGTYREALTTKVAGTAAAPITIKGPETGKVASGRYKATLYSLGGRVVSINHSYYTLDGFTIDGQPNIARTEYPASPTLAGIRSFKDSVQTFPDMRAKAVNSKLVYVGAATTTLNIVGTTISNMFLNGSGGECIRFRNLAANSLVDNSVIQWCGMLGQGDDKAQYKYHNAEGVYVGTSPKSTDQPQYANDSSNNIVVRNSTINTFGSECFEVKENAHHNRIENSDCGFNDEPLSFQGSNVEFRGDHNTVLNTRLSQSRSWNMKLASDSSTYDRGGNTAQRTAFSGAATYAIINRQTGSGPFCGNTFTGSVSDPSGNSIGSPTAACPDTTAPTAPTGLTAKANSPTSVTLTWTAATDNVGVTGYLVRRNGTQVGTPTTPSYTDTTAASTTYSYTVVARDAAGNLSPASTAASVTTPAATTPPAAQVINAEAESGVLASGMVAITDTTAQGGKYVTQTTGTSTGTDTITVNVPVAGRYALAGRVKAAGSSSDSFTYKIDTGTTTVWNLGTRTSWTWVTATTVTLTAGQHKIVVSKRENGARLDAIRLTPA
jgi:hypothetical protein